jgi:hypothetical protein
VSWHLDCGACWSFATAVEPTPLIIDHRLAILPEETQLSQLMRPKPRAFEGQRLNHQSNVGHRRSKKDGI